MDGWRLMFFCFALKLLEHEQVLALFVKHSTLFLEFSSKGMLSGWPSPTFLQDFGYDWRDLQQEVFMPKLMHLAIYQVSRWLTVRVINCRLTTSPPLSSLLV